MSEIIRVDDIHKSYEKDEVLKGISLSVNAGKVTSIIGSSGSGKSTLLRCLNLLEVPNKGNIYFKQKVIPLTINKQGQSIVEDTKKLQQLRTKISMVFQHFNLWTHKTVLENVIQAPILVLKKSKKQAEQEGIHYLEKVGLKEHSHKYPAQLSGGQKQRVGIARALAMKPDLLLFDEPTSALDPEMVAEVLNITEELCKEGCTMVMVSHELEFVNRVSDTIIFLKDGKIFEQGTDILKNPKTESLQYFLSHLLTL